MRFGTMLAMVFTLATGNVFADSLTPFQPGPSDVVLADVQPHFNTDDNRNNEYYSEWWSFVFTLENGYWAYVQFLVSNLGPGDGNAVVTAEVRVPGAEKYSEKTELKNGQWSWATDSFALKFGENTLSGPLDALKIHLKNASFEADFQLKNVVPPWKPGTGRAQYGASASRYYKFALLAPVALLDGTVKIEGEDTVHNVKGFVHADHSLCTVGMQEQAKRWMRFRAVNPKTTLIVSDIEPPSIYGSERIQFAVLFSEGKKVFETTRFNIKFDNEYVDPKKTGYSTPRLVEINSTDGGTKARFVIKTTKLTGREDFLETAGAAKRFVISKFAKPIMYDFDGVFAAEVITDGKAEKFGSKGRYYFAILNL